MFSVLALAFGALFQNCAVGGGDSGTLNLGSNSPGGTTSGTTTGGATRCSQVGGYIQNNICYNNNEECMNAAAIGGPYTFPQSNTWVGAAQGVGMTGCTASEASATTCTNCCTDLDVFPAGSSGLNKLRAFCTGNIY